MSNPITTFESDPQSEVEPTGRISVEEVSRRLKLGRLSVYKMLNEGTLPGIRVGRRWIITRHSYAHWESTCGVHSGAGLPAAQEVTVVN